MIINEIDEKNSKNNRTTDTETGIYLKAAGVDQRDHMYSFLIVDGEIKIDVITYMKKDWKDQGKKIMGVDYMVDLVRVNGRSNRKKYKSVIEALLQECGASFRAGERSFGNIQEVSVRFRPQAVEALDAWEKGIA